MTVGDLQTASTGVCVLSAQVQDAFTTNLVHIHADLHALRVTIIDLHICRPVIVTGSAVALHGIKKQSQRRSPNFSPGTIYNLQFTTTLKL